MDKILIAVDDTKSSKDVFNKSAAICKGVSPAEIALVFVEKFEGRSLIDEMLGDTEMATLKEVLEGTELKETLDAKADKILDHYKSALEGNGCAAIVKKVVRSGHPAGEILQAAKDENADMIIIGSRGQRVSSLFMGSVSREVANNAEIPVLIMR